MNKNALKHFFAVACVVAAACALSACGQRVEPKAPDGKIVPSSQY